jgi:phenolic acid decarboxylase
LALFLFESIIIYLLDKAGVQLHIEVARAERITLRNTQGQMVAETVQKQSLNLTDVAQGVYTVEVQTNHGT